MIETTFVYAIYIATTSERLWEALTSGECQKNIGLAMKLNLIGQ